VSALNRRQKHTITMKDKGSTKKGRSVIHREERIRKRPHTERQDRNVLSRASAPSLSRTSC